MNYAILEDGVVTNIVVGPLPEGIDGVTLNGRPVTIGDVLADGMFLRNGDPVLTDAERIAKLEARVAELEAK